MAGGQGRRLRYGVVVGTALVILAVVAGSLTWPGADDPDGRDGDRGSDAVSSVEDAGIPVLEGAY